MSSNLNWMIVFLIGLVPVIYLFGLLGLYIWGIVCILCYDKENGYGFYKKR